MAADIITILSSGALSVVSSGTLSVALVYLSKTWISERMKASIQCEYDQKLETHRAQLKSQSEVELARLKADLEIVAAERSFRFSHVFEKTAQTIETTYKKLVGLRDAVNDHNAALELSDEHRRRRADEIVQERRQEFEAFFKENRIYIPKTTAKKIQDFSTVLSNYQFKYARLVAVERSPTTSDSAMERRSKEIEKLIYDIPALLSALEDDFQRILGFPMDDKSGSAA